LDILGQSIAVENPSEARPFPKGEKEKKKIEASHRAAQKMP